MKPITLIAICLAALFLVEPVLADDDAELRKQMEELTKEVKGLRERVKELEGEPAPEAVNIEEGSIGEAIQQMAGSNVDAPRTTTLVIGGQVRVQPLWYSNRDLDSQTSDALEFVILRTRIHFDFDIAETLRAFVEIQDSRVFGEEGGVLAALEGLDLLQGFVDFRNIFGDGWLLRIGRQRMSYGAQRVISDLDWHPVGRAWDGVWLEYETETVDARLFLTRIDENLLGSGVSEEEDFYGIYSTFDVGEVDKVSGYLLYRRNMDEDDNVGEDGENGKEKLWSLGGRYFGKSSGWQYDVEAVYQFGDFANDSISAWMFEARGGYTCEGSDWKPTILASFIYASGDDDPTDGDRNTYDQLYTFSHYYLGYIDFVGRRNILSPMLRLQGRPSDEWIVSLDTHVFWLDTVNDSLYNAVGKAVRTDPTGEADSFVGWEIDLHAKWIVSKNLKLWFGYSHFFAGSFYEDTGTSDDADFVFIQITVDF